MTLENDFSFSQTDEYTQLLTELHNQYCQDQPEDVLQYCANFFNQKLQHERHLLLNHQTDNEHHPLAQTENYQAPELDSSDDIFEDEEEDFFDTQDSPFSTAAAGFVPPPSHHRGRRTSVSAESIAPMGHDFVKTKIFKTDAQAERIKSSVGNNFLFKNLDHEHHQDVVDAMAEVKVAQGEKIIEQGAVGDYFYIVDTGTFDCFIDVVKVASYEQGGSFGELALMYNAPRAATIVATSQAILWALDRVTFRTILMENTSLKRKMYESFLEELVLLKSLEPYERHKIADALESVYFAPGENIVTQGERGDQFYIVESGTALVYKTDEHGVQHHVNQLERGSYFGELALLNDSPRAATVVAETKLKCATLGKKAFTRLLGSVYEILKRNSENYHAILNQL